MQQNEFFKTIEPTTPEFFTEVSLELAYVLFEMDRFPALHPNVVEGDDAFKELQDISNRFTNAKKFFLRALRKPIQEKFGNVD